MDKETRNAIVSRRYDELRAEGKHGHYECLFRVVHEIVDAELARVREELEIERAKFPTMGSPLQKLGALLADLLDADHFNNAEQYLLAAHENTERVARRTLECWQESGFGDKPLTFDEIVAQAMRGAK